jgi:hypothetical protein
MPISDVSVQVFRASNCSPLTPLRTIKDCEKHSVTLRVIMLKQMKKYIFVIWGTFVFNESTPTW